MKQNAFWALALTVTRLPAAIAQQYVYPAKRQSPQQQPSYDWLTAACLEGRGYAVK